MYFDSSVVAPPTVATLLRVVGPMLLQSTRELPHPSQLAQSIAVCTEPKFYLKTLGNSEAKVMVSYFRFCDVYMNVLDEYLKERR